MYLLKCPEVSFSSVDDIVTVGFLPVSLYLSLKCPVQIDNSI